MVENSEEINLLPGRPFKFRGGRPYGAEMHSRLEPFLEKHRLNRIGGAGHNVCTLACLRSGCERTHLFAERGAHFLREPVPILPGRTENANVLEVEPGIEAKQL